MAGWRGRGLRATLLAVLALLSGEQFPHTSFLGSSKLILYSSYSAPMPHSHPLGAHHQPAGATHLHAVPGPRTRSSGARLRGGDRAAGAGIRPQVAVQ